jgi:hypothetical protein
VFYDLGEAPSHQISVWDATASSSMHVRERSIPRWLSHPRVIFAIWLCLLVVIQVVAWSHDCTPNPSRQSAPAWPEQSHLPKVRGQFTVQMFVRDDCPCSLASLRELDRLLAGVPVNRVAQATIVFVGLAQDEREGLWDYVATLPRLNAIRDSSTEEARRFRVETSGTLTVHDQKGRLVFQGGLTVARGHEGESTAFSRLQDRLRRADSADAHVIRFPVFGCSLETDPGAS